MKVGTLTHNTSLKSLSIESIKEINQVLSRILSVTSIWIGFPKVCIREMSYVGFGQTHKEKTKVSTQ